MLKRELQVLTKDSHKFKYNKTNEYFQTPTYLIGLACQ